MNFHVGTAYDLHLRHVVASENRSSVKMPWDVKMATPWEVCKRMRGEQLFDLGTMPPMPRMHVDATTTAGSAEHSLDDALKAAGITLKSSNDTRLWSEKLSWERKTAYKKWSTLIAKSFNSWEICRQIWTGDEVKASQGGLIESLKDALGNKASSTIHARAGPLIQYVNFHETNGLQCFPLSESGVYYYMKNCGHKSPSFLRSFLLSVSFANFHFGLDGAKEVLSSGRIRGCSQIHYAQIRKLVQRPPLTVQQVIALEQIVLDPNRSDADRLASGFYLMLVYGRLRFSDAQQVSNLVLDMPNVEQGFLEGTAGRTKTSISLERKCRLLPIAIPTMCFSDEPWIPCWLDLRKKIFGDHREGEQMPMLPSPAAGGGWTKLPLSVGAGSQWLRSLLSKVPHTSSIPLGTHGCKATVLSWASKWAMAHGPRRLLGYHSSGRDKSMLTYSRDGISGPLRLMVRMLNDIKSGAFIPDSTRSGRFRDDYVNHEAVEEDRKSDVSSSSSDGSDNETEVDHDGDEEAAKNVIGAWDPGESEEGTNDPKYVRHRVSRCIHILMDEGGSNLKCGRRMATTYVFLLRKPGFMHPLCTTCFKADSG